MLITQPKSFIRQLAEELTKHRTAILRVEQIPESYQVSPANLCIKLRTRFQMHVRYNRIGQTMIFNLD